VKDWIDFVVWWWGRAGFVVWFAVCVIIESLNPPLQDWEDWCAIAWNIRRDFVIWWWRRAGFVVWFAVCVMIESLNPPLQDWGDWRAIAW